MWWRERAGGGFGNPAVRVEDTAWAAAGLSGMPSVVVFVVVVGGGVERAQVVEGDLERYSLAPCCCGLALGRINWFNRREVGI